MPIPDQDRRVQIEPRTGASAKTEDGRESTDTEDQNACRSKGGRRRALDSNSSRCRKTPLWQKEQALGGRGPTTSLTGGSCQEANSRRILGIGRHSSAAHVPTMIQDLRPVLAKDMPSESSVLVCPRSTRAGDHRLRARRVGKNSRAVRAEKKASQSRAGSFRRR